MRQPGKVLFTASQFAWCPAGLNESSACLVIFFQQVTQPLVSKQASHLSLPHIGSPTTISMEKHPVTIHEPTAIRTARRVSVNFTQG